MSEGHEDLQRRRTAEPTLEKIRSRLLMRNAVFRRIDSFFFFYGSPTACHSRGVNYKTNRKPKRVAGLMRCAFIQLQRPKAQGTGDGGDAVSPLHDTGLLRFIPRNHSDAACARERPLKFKSWIAELTFAR